jgi:hypothetical protein
MATRSTCMAIEQVTGAIFSTLKDMDAESINRCRGYQDYMNQMGDFKYGTRASSTTWAMIEDREIKLDRVRCMWSFDSHITSPKKCWPWTRRQSVRNARYRCRRPHQPPRRDQPDDGVGFGTSFFLLKVGVPMVEHPYKQRLSRPHFALWMNCVTSLEHAPANASSLSPRGCMRETGSSV